MGIGNLSDRVEDGRLDVVLITPHGDRKPVKETLSHLWRDGKCLSLPLMGIGNIGMPADHRWCPIATSLPLMGIGNAIRLGGALLIAAALSLPLMGIGNPILI